MIWHYFNQYLMKNDFFLNKKRYRIESIVKYGGVEIKNEGIVDGRGDRCEGFEFNFSVIFLSDMHFSVL